MFKMMLMLFTSMIFLNYVTWELFSAIMFLMMAMCLLTPMVNNSEYLPMMGIKMNNISFLLSILSLLTMFWAVSFSSFSLENKSKSLLMILNLVLILTLQSFFITNNIMNLYILFELSVIPIFIIIMGWGYQSERLNASLSLMFYTLTASLPLLIILMWVININSWFSFNAGLMNSFHSQAKNSFLLSLIILMAFAVKLPMFGVHIWLPKAHVEAPVFGSMILAAILLKLGSYGLWLFINLVFYFEKMGLWVSISLLGSVMTSLLCVRMTDIKMIIAYSSVGHMGLVFSGMVFNNFIGGSGALMLMLAHGASSSSMFLMAYLMYKGNYSRSLLLTKGIMIWSNTIPLFWFLILMSNMAAPPTFNLLSEVMIIISTVNYSSVNLSILMLVIMLSTAYSLILFSSSIQGTLTLNSNSMTMNLLDQMVILNHLVWLLMLTLSVAIINF